MAIQVKLGQYRADEENVRDPSAKAITVLIVVGAVVLLGVVVYFFAGGGSGAAAKEVAVAAGDPSTTEGSGARFVSTNWNHLEPGEDKDLSRNRESNFDSSDWGDADVYKGLQGMAVYEVEDSDEDEETSDEIARKLFGVKS
jgi:hypothetical protein